MAVVSTCPIVSCKDHVHPTTKVIRLMERGGTDYCLPWHKEYRCYSFSLIKDGSRRWNISHNGSEITSKSKRSQRVDTCCAIYHWFVTFQNITRLPLPKINNIDVPENAKSGMGHQPRFVSSALEASNCEKQLKTLDSYFSKLHDDMAGQLSNRIPASISETLPGKKGNKIESSSEFEGKTFQRVDTGDHYEEKTGLESLEDYFSKLSTGIDTKKTTSSICRKDASKRNLARMPTSSPEEYNWKEDVVAKANDSKDSKSADGKNGPELFGEENTPSLQTDDEASDFYLINLLAALNIAVFLFEIASPIRNSDIEQLSLPLIYGGKINKLILLGEWWRLLTPMFLHAGLLHIALGCWVLFTFGPQVCRVYGPFTFFLIYVLGGICGNLTSFIHTPELTVCGTGPVFAIIGAWLVYQIQNKEVAEREDAESMSRTVLISTVLNFILSSFERVDNWTHLGAAISGIIFGYLTCPTLEFDNASSKNGQKEGFALVQRQADPCKSFITFTLSTSVLFSLAFYYGSQLEILHVDGFE